jgi:hypothetical protein
MEQISDYNQLSLSELSKLATIRKCTVKTKIKSAYIKALKTCDENTKNEMVCGLCKQPCERINSPCGHVCHITCCSKNNDDFYICSICACLIHISNDDMECLYANQEMNH